MPPTPARMRLGSIRHPLQMLRRAVSLALLLPFLALTLISPSVMAARGANGQMEMVLCTTDGPVTMLVDLGTDGPKPADPCDWATAHAAVIDLPQPDAPAQHITMHRAAPDRASALWHPAHDPRDLWARGPPAFA